MKLLILSYPFYEYGEMITKAFSNAGHDVRYHAYGYSSEGIKNLIRYSIPRGLGLDVESKKREEFAVCVNKEIKSFGPDAILLIRGDFLSDMLVESIKNASNRPKIAVWVMDGIDQLSNLLRYKNIIDQWFVFEPTDVSKLKRQYRIDANFLPLAYDPSYYHPILKYDPKVELQADISFIGSVKDKNRLILLNGLSKWSIKKELDFKIITGNYIPRNYHLIYPYRSLWKNLYTNNLHHSKVNTLYNNCVVNINIHKDQSVQGLNMRFFEILGSGSLQLVEEKKSQHFLGFKPNQDFLTYSCYEEMIENIQFVKNNPKIASQIAKNGYEKSKNHTFENRASDILNFLN